MRAVLFCCSLWTLAALGATASAQAVPDSITISGSAGYRQRIALPPEAVLTVRIEDVSRADVPAKLLAQTREVFGARQVPVPFSLTVPRSAIDARARYALRASISVGSKLRFASDSDIPVLAPGAPDKFDLLLVAATGPVPAVTATPPATPPATLPAAPAAPPEPQVGFALPATFTGVLPCADCAGIANTLTLRADGLYRLRRTYLGKPGEPQAEAGRWVAAAGGARITLGRGQAEQWFAVVNAETLQLLDRQGQPFKSSANLALRRTAELDTFSEPLRWRGGFVYFADAAHFTDCASGLRWPVAVAGDYLAAERAYTAGRGAPGAPLAVQFDGRLEIRSGMEGPPREHIVIGRFASSHPGAVCDTPPASPAVAVAALKDTYWKLVELRGQPVVAPEAPEAQSAQQREVRITLASGGTRVFGFAGCNNLVGEYQQDGTSLRFDKLAGTMMACDAPFMALETQVHQMLRATTAHRIEGQRMTLLAGDAVLARFEAVYLR